MSVSWNGSYTRRWHMKKYAEKDSLWHKPLWKSPQWQIILKKDTADLQLRLTDIMVTSLVVKNVNWIENLFFFLILNEVCFGPTQALEAPVLSIVKNTVQTHRTPQTHCGSTFLNWGKNVSTVSSSKYTPYSTCKKTWHSEEIVQTFKYHCSFSFPWNLIKINGIIEI